MADWRSRYSSDEYLLTELDDMLISSALTNQVFQYNGTKWENRTNLQLIDDATIGIASDTDLLTLADSALTVAGTIGSGTVTTTGQFVAPTSAAPTPPVKYAFTGNLTTGMGLEPITPNLFFKIADTAVMHLKTTGMEMPANLDVTLSGTGHVTSGSEGFIVGNTTITDEKIDCTGGTIVLADGAGFCGLTGIKYLDVGSATYGEGKFSIDLEGFMTQDSGVASDTYFSQTGVGHWEWKRNNPAAAGFNMKFYRSRGNRTNFGVLSDDDEIAQFLYYSGTAGVTPNTIWTGVIASQSVRVDGGHTAGSSYPTKFVWSTTANGATAEREVLTLNREGDLTFMVSSDSASVADEVTLGGYEISANNRALAISSEAAVAADADEQKFSHKLPVRINGATYYIMLTTT